MPSKRQSAATEASAGAKQTLRALLERPGAPIVIGVAGDSGSGKTTYTNGLRRMLGGDIVGTIAMDGYHREDREQRRVSGRLPLDPANNRLDLLREHLEVLKRGGDVEVPVYNHQNGRLEGPVPFAARPILVVEGLHALYPELLPLLDFGVYVDPERGIKWRWKMARDLRYRGHAVEYLTDEMLNREAGYRRWVEFQKAEANVVIKIHESRLQALCQGEYRGEAPEDCHYLELIFQPISMALPHLRLSFNLAKMLGDDPPPFLLASVPRTYWGRRANSIHVDGLFTRRAVELLERQIVNFTGIALDQEFRGMAHERLSSTLFTQLLVTWPILEHIAGILEQRPEPEIHRAAG